MKIFYLSTKLILTIGSCFDKQQRKRLCHRMFIHVVRVLREGGSYDYKVINYICFTKITCLGSISVIRRLFGYVNCFLL